MTRDEAIRDLAILIGPRLSPAARKETVEDLLRALTAPDACPDCAEIEAGRADFKAGRFVSLDDLTPPAAGEVRRWLPIGDGWMGLVDSDCGLRDAGAGPYVLAADYERVVESEETYRKGYLALNTRMAKVEELREAAQAEVERLRHKLTNAGVCELGADNVNVRSYCKEWEQRAEQAEARAGAGEGADAPETGSVRRWRTCGSEEFIPSGDWIAAADYDRAIKGEKK